MRFLLNTNGSVDLDAAERDLKLAKAASYLASAEMHTRGRSLRYCEPWGIKYGRALAAFYQARDEFAGAIERERECRGAIDEALNPEHS